MRNSHNSDGASPFRLGIELTPDRPISTVVDLAQAAEDGGIDVTFVSNHYHNRDPTLALARIAGATDGMKLGPGVVNPYETHPARLATQLASLDELSGGRAVFGIGAGDRSTIGTLGMERTEPVRTVRETIGVARRLWAGERVDHDGTFDLRAARLNYETQQIPVLVGAQGPSMLRMSAAVADGVLLNAAHPADYRWARQHIDAGLDRRENDRGPITVAGFASVSIAEDAARAREAARPPVAFITAGAPDGVIDRHDLDRDRVTAVREALADDRHAEAYERVTRPMINAFCVAGTTDMVTDRLAALLEQTDAMVAASPLGPDRRAAVDLLSTVRNRLAQTGAWSA